MPRPDDCTLPENQLLKVKREAERALRDANALGVFPTPVGQIMAAAKVEEIQEDVLNPSFVSKLRASVGEKGHLIKKALSKVLGLFDARDSLIFIDRSLHQVKQTFIRLHETAHGFLPWQRPMYAIVEDSAEALQPDVAEAFDREANVFASEVLFQRDTFINEASDHNFSIFVPVRLSKKYGASIYASMRQYVSKNHRNCAVLVLDTPQLVEGDGFHAELRRPIQSSVFTEQFGAGNWPDKFTPSDQIGAMVPLGKQKSSSPREIRLKDLNGDDHIFIAEAFTQTWQVFILIHHAKSLNKKSVFIQNI